MYQDNKSTTLLDKNGMIFSPKKGKHIKAIFFIKDTIKNGDIKVENCPIERMWLDILNKPNQGNALHLYRGKLLNVTEDYDNEVERSNTHPNLITEDDRFTFSS